MVALNPFAPAAGAGDDAGQALVMTVFLIAIAAAAIVSLSEAQRRISDFAQRERAGEAAVEAAAASLADAYVARGHRSVSAVVSDETVLATARFAAAELARANGRSQVGGLQVVCENGRVETSLVLEGSTHHAAFEAHECSHR